MNGLVIRCGFGKWALCDGKTENGEFGLGTVVNWYDTFEEAVEMREKINKCYTNNNRVEAKDKKGEIIARASKLFKELDEFGIVTVEDYTKELNEQFQEGNYNQYLRMGLGFEIEQGSKEAREVMKLLIKYNLGA